MINYIKSKTKGFTIIEVLIVLAIAGLILSIVFVAVPQLQRNARDSKRQSIANRLSSELNSYSANNQGSYPWVNMTGSFSSCTDQPSAPNKTCDDWFNRYIDGGKVDVKDPKTGSDTEISIASTGSLPGWSLGNVYISPGAKCDGDRPPTGGTGATTSSKQYALTITLERQNTYYCVDNG